MCDQNKLITPETFSESVLIRSFEKKESILESLTFIVEELDIDEDAVKKMVTPPLLSRLEAECHDHRLLKNRPRSKKLI